MTISNKTSHISYSVNGLRNTEKQWREASLHHVAAGYINVPLPLVLLSGNNTCSVTQVTNLDN